MLGKSSLLIACPNVVSQGGHSFTDDYGTMRPRTHWCLLTFGVALLAAGCHELQPHRLQRLNRGTGLSPDVYYSVPDPALPPQPPDSPGWRPVAQPPGASRGSVAGDEPVGTAAEQPLGDFASQ
jgi:hypothetical protein